MIDPVADVKIHSELNHPLIVSDVIFLLVLDVVAEPPSLLLVFRAMERLNVRILRDDVDGVVWIRFYYGLRGKHFLSEFARLFEISNYAYILLQDITNYFRSDVACVGDMVNLYWNYTPFRSEINTYL